MLRVIESGVDRIGTNLVAVGYRLSTFRFVRAIANEDLFGLDPAMIGEHLKQLLRLRTRTLATVTDTARRLDRRLRHDDKPGTRQRQGTEVLERPVIRRPFSALY